MRYVCVEHAELVLGIGEAVAVCALRWVLKRHNVNISQVVCNIHMTEFGIEKVAGPAGIGL